MLLDYKKLIDRQLNDILNDLPSLPIYNPIKYILNLGGKRFRASLTLLSADIYCGNPQKAIHEAAAIELFHNFTLIHDDIMDDAPLRRAQPTVHEKWDPNTAILSGDLLYAFVNKILALSPVQSSKIHFLFQQTALEVCEGQSLDMAFENQVDVSKEDYIHMIKLKTAVLVACGLKIGALIGGASQADASLMYDFGINLGIAFQIHDDILDVYPTEATFGKKVGGDILEKKKTLLFIDLLSKLKDESIKELYVFLDDSAIDEQDKIDHVKTLFQDYNVLSVVELSKDEYYNEALRCVNQLSIKDSEKSKLMDFAKALMERKY